MATLVGPGSIAPAGPTSQLWTTPFPHAPGDKSRDRDGNEYLFVDFTATVYFGTLVQINSLYQAAPLLGTANEAYRVGVVMGGLATTVSPDHPTSDNGGWVQVYGVHPAVQTGRASDAATAQLGAIPQTSVGTPSGILTFVAPGAQAATSGTSTEANLIYGMWLVPEGQVTDLVTYPGASGSSGAATNNNWLTDNATQTSGANTSAFIGSTYAVYMNYPYVTGNALLFSDAAS